jgi:SAM-dependent methyltransferase
MRDHPRRLANVTHSGPPAKVERMHRPANELVSNADPTPSTRQERRISGVRSTSLDLARSTVFLDAIEQRIVSGDLYRALEQLLATLNLWRDRAATPGEWQRAIALVRAHSLHALLRQDPFTDRAFSKPRGYAGDAAMLDFCYDPPGSHLERVPTAVGAAILRFIHATASARGVRERRRILARAIDDAVQRTSIPTIVSVACGHARELDASRGFIAGAPLRFVALDQDEASLQRLQRCNDSRIVPARTSVRDVLQGTLQLPACDLVYSTGLYDYLDDATATRLTQRMFDTLRPGGRLLVANMLPGVEMRGYMEAVMDWRLTYRSEAELRAIGYAVTAAARRVRTYVDPHATFAYLEMERE